MMKMQMLKRGGMTSRVTQEDILDGITPSTLMSGLKRENCHKKRFNINYQLYDGKHVLLSTLSGFVLDTVSMSIMNHRISKVDSNSLPATSIAKNDSIIDSIVDVNKNNCGVSYIKFRLCSAGLKSFEGI